MALITVDILKNDNPELYEEIKDVLEKDIYGIFDDPVKVDRYIRIMDLETYLHKIDYFNIRHKEAVEAARTGVQDPFITNLRHSNILWSSKY